MNELLRVTEEPRTCSYLPKETASLEYRLVTGLEPQEYAELLARGYRRFGLQLFRPACKDCSRCVSLRILVQEFRPSRSQRRVLRNNQDLRVRRLPVFVTEKHLELYNRYHRFKANQQDWPQTAITAAEYNQSFVAGRSGFAHQWLFWHGKRLAAVALMDEVPGAISLVYAYYDPACTERSLGTLAILTQLAYARRRGLRYAYPGYWIAANRSMAYKERFRPHERLLAHPADHQKPVWRRVETGKWPREAVA